MIRKDWRLGFIVTRVMKGGWNWVSDVANGN